MQDSKSNGHQDLRRLHPRGISIESCRGKLEDEFQEAVQNVQRVQNIRAQHPKVVPVVRAHVFI